MVFPEFQELHTTRLILRRMGRKDAEDFFRFAGSESVTQYMLWKPHGSIAESQASIAKTLARYETGRCYRWAIALRDSDDLIGIIDLLGFDETQNQCSFAYMLAEAYWGNGYGTEALIAVLDFAFQEMGMDAVEADHFAANEASGAVMRKAGMAFIGTQMAKYEKNGIPQDAHRYRITRQMWQNHSR